MLRAEPLPGIIADPTLPPKDSLLRGSIDPIVPDTTIDPLTGRTLGADAERPFRRSAQKEVAEEVAASPGKSAQNDENPASDIVTGALPPRGPDAAARASRVPAVGQDESMEQARRVGGDDIAHEENPFDPLGIRAGKFIFYPSMETGIEASTNPYRNAGGESGSRSISTLRLRAQSDWGEHEARAEGFATFEKDLSRGRDDILRGGFDASLRYDFIDGYALNAGVNWRAERETGSSAAGPADIANDPLRHDITGTLGVSREVGHLRLETEGKVFRQIYGDAELGDGTVRSQKERNSTLATARIRVGYEISPALVPFVEGEFGKRYYDEQGGDDMDRDADRYALRGGIAVDLGEKTKGEIALGWLTERPEDDRLSDVSGFSVDGRLDWSPMRGTLVGLTGSTTVESTTAFGESGSLLYALRLNIEREVRHNITAGLTLGADWRDYITQDAGEQKLLAELSATWWFNRQLGLTSRLSHERFTSDLPGRDYDSNSIFVGITARR
ncbi:outer membrane beta-barrel protein [Limoniibacter endophyticus]|uniref:Outer membrane beta-barrel protein n=1 Tax=Limoniibacter endophyticus TaxID=1565040 RepID=A0A8J3DFG6_9HYPH|nr:outer membrane beta-barrel protein [Limoniibacter endophyticus]GHC64209.1 hypothetical protein GCM10010136_06040 [Limoniibacter endophyticus]